MIRLAPRSKTAATLLLPLMASLVVATALAAEESDNLFRSEIARVEIAKPASWIFQNLEIVARHRASVDLDDEELEDAIQRLTTAPLVVATKHPEPHDGLNPSLQLIVRPMPSDSEVSGRQILEMVRPTLEGAFEGFAVDGGITEFELSGLTAARMTASYTVRNREGALFPTRATLVVVPRESFLYQLSFSAPPDGPDALGAEIDEVLASFRFLD